MTKPKPFVPSTVLLIPDVHAKPGDTLERFSSLTWWLEKRNVKLSKIIQIGDLWSFESLSLHDKDKPEFNDRSLSADLHIGRLAYEEISSIATAHNLAAKDIIITEGNHEDRYARYFQSDNRLRTSDFPKNAKQYLTTKYNADSMPTWVPFQKPWVYKDVAFCHYFVSGVMNRPQGGERPAANLVRSQLMSTVCGHIHTLDFAERTRADGKKIYSLVSGCFVDPSSEFKYAGAARKLWWSGCHLLHFTAPGEFDIESISLERMSNV